MKYVGSKRRIAKDLAPILIGNLPATGLYVEPFVGGANMLEHIPAATRIANDNHFELIAMWRALQDGWNPPEYVSEDQYNSIKNNRSQYPAHLVGYVGFNSYGGKWWGGYCRDKTGRRDYWDEHYRHMMRQIAKLGDVDFIWGLYHELRLPDKALIYCDPPYAGTLGYGGAFDHAAFWQWCRDMHAQGHTVMVSEYAAPDDFVAIWEKPINNTLAQDTGGKQGTERLFVPRDTSRPGVNNFTLQS